MCKCITESLGLILSKMPPVLHGESEEGVGVAPPGHLSVTGRGPGGGRGRGAPRTFRLVRATVPTNVTW